VQSVRPDEQEVRSLQEDSCLKNGNTMAARDSLEEQMNDKDYWYAVALER
jgi:hypothetical protein